MGWKEVLKVFIGIFLFVSLLIFVFSFSFFQITSYNVLEPRFHSLVQQGMNEQLQKFTADDWNKEKAGLIKNCTDKEHVHVPIIDNSNIRGFAGSNLPKEIQISCINISDITIEDLMSISSKQMFDSIYYQNFSCNFLQCFSDKNNSENELLLFASKNANNFFATVSFILIIATLFFIVFIFLLSQPKYTSFYEFAPVFMVAGLPFMLFAILKANVVSLFGNFSNAILPFINSFFVNFLVVFCIGIVFLILAVTFASIHKGSKKNIEENE